MALLDKKNKKHKCPRNKKIKLMSEECMACEHHNSKKWFSYGGVVADNTFCMLDMNKYEKKHLK